LLQDVKIIIALFKKIQNLRLTFAKCRAKLLPNSKGALDLIDPQHLFFFIDKGDRKNEQTYNSKRLQTFA
jgi:hypothetical protein